MSSHSLDSSKSIVSPFDIARGRIARGSLETAVAYGATAAIALHLLDDNFLQPEPGTSATGHLASGLVPLALLLAFMFGYARLRAGLRAALAITLGLFAIVAGAGEAGTTPSVGPSGDDYTGLLALLAGVMFVGLGATTLWTSRRTTTAAAPVSPAAGSDRACGRRCYVVPFLSHSRTCSRTRRAPWFRKHAWERRTRT